MPLRLETRVTPVVAAELRRLSPEQARFMAWVAECPQHLASTGTPGGDQALCLARLPREGLRVVVLCL